VSLLERELLSGAVLRHTNRREPALEAMRSLAEWNESVEKALTPPSHLITPHARNH